MALTHAQIWSAIDALARSRHMSASGLAKSAGLDPTSFNKSKRISGDPTPRPRWPSTESVAKVLAATGRQLRRVRPAGGAGRPARPLRAAAGLAQAGADGFFDDAGFPVGQGWDEVDLPSIGREGAYALEISGDSMAPVYRDGDRIVVAPDMEPRRGDRVVVKTREGEVMAKELSRLTAGKLELRSLNPEYPARTLDRKDVAWIARIIWASQ
jgi:phage repressor protein C with HTH and peptisase S24 domain